MNAGILIHNCWPRCPVMVEPKLGVHVTVLREAIISRTGEGMISYWANYTRTVEGLIRECYDE